MKKSEIKEMTNEALLTAFYWNAVHTTNEVNSRRGLTKQTQKEEAWIHEEVCNRFNLDVDEFRKKIVR